MKRLHLFFYCLSWFPLKCFIQLSVSQRSDVLCGGMTESLLSFLPKNYVFHTVGSELHNQVSN